jgi:hypothetical protein
VQGVPGLVLDWVDRAVPKGAHTAMIPYVIPPDWGRAALQWWDVEFWNRSVDRVFVVDGRWEYAPFPNRELHVDPLTGVIAGTAHEPEYVVAAADDSRFHLTSTQLFRNYEIDVLRVKRPYRVDWLSIGLDPDGWIRPPRRASIRVFSQPGRSTELFNVDVQLIDIAGIGHIRRQTLCVASGRYTDLELPKAKLGTVGPLPLNPPEGGERLVGWRVGVVGAFPTGTPC